MSKHTPGPWHVIERANGQAFSVGCQVQTKGNFLTTDYIANITDMATPQAEANARIIAAAPQMLEALESAVRFIENGIEMGYISEPQPGTPENATLSAIKDAIRAAKGEV